MVIFLDDSEVGGISGEKALTKGLLDALENKTSPLLVSGHLLKNYWQAGQKINEEDWWIKQVNERLFLLFSREGHRGGGDVGGNDPKAFTRAEYETGLKTNRLPTVSFEEIVKMDFDHVEDAHYFIEALDNSQIFMERKQYKSRWALKNSAGEVLVPRWFFYLNGHGSYQSIIAYLEIKDFQIFLEFIEHKIHTALLAVTSCYAAGANFAQIMHDNKNSIMGKAYPFALITATSTDATTRTTANVSKFSKYIDQSDYVDPLKAAQILYEELAYRASDIVQIRLPETEWFSFLDSQIASIGQILAKTHSSTLSFDAQKYFNKPKLKYLFLGAKYIPFPVHISNKKFTFDAVVSSIPGDAMHYLTEFRAQNVDFSRVRGWFSRIDKLGPTKIFFINTVFAKDGEFKNVYIFNQGTKRYAYYTENGQYFFSPLLGQKKVLVKDSLEYQEYIQVLDQIYGRASKINEVNAMTSGYFVELSANGQNLAPFFNRTLIEEIPLAKTKKVSAEAMATIDSLVALTKNLLWVKELTGIYESEKKCNFARAKKSSFVYIEDLIIDKESEEIYLSVENIRYKASINLDQCSKYSGNYMQKYASHFLDKELSNERTIKTDFSQEEKKTLLDRDTLDTDFIKKIDRILESFQNQ